MDERGRRRARFYSAPAPPQAHSHCTRAAIFQQTHLQSKISYLMAQVVFWFPSTLPFHFLVSDMPTRPCRLLSSAGMRSPRISSAGTQQYRLKTSPKWSPVLLDSSSLPEGCVGARDNILFLPLSSHHHALWPHALDSDQQETQWPGHFSKHIDHPAIPLSCASAGKKVMLRAMAITASWSCLLGYSPVLRARFPGAGMELPWPQGNSALHGTRACRQHALPTWPHTKRLAHGQSKIRV